MSEEITEFTASVASAIKALIKANWDGKSAPTAAMVHVATELVYADNLPEANKAHTFLCNIAEYNGMVNAEKLIKLMIDSPSWTENEFGWMQWNPAECAIVSMKCSGSKSVLEVMLAKYGFDKSNGWWQKDDVSPEVWKNLAVVAFGNAQQVKVFVSGDDARCSLLNGVYGDVVPQRNPGESWQVLKTVQEHLENAKRIKRGYSGTRLHKVLVGEGIPECVLPLVK